MSCLRELFKGKGDGKERAAALKIAAGFTAGVLLLISANTLFAGKPGGAAPGAAAQGASGGTQARQGALAQAGGTSPGYEKDLEARLGAILSRVEGAGEVSVMITLAHSHELVIAEDGEYDRTHTEETDAQGGARTVESLSTSGKKITIRGEDGSAAPLIIKTAAPKVEGVIITAGGGGDAVVKEQLISAAQTVLGVEPHKVQVLKSISSGG